MSRSDRTSRERGERDALVERLAELYRGGSSIARVSAATVGKNKVLRLLREAVVETRPRHREKPVSERKLAIEPEELARLYREEEGIEHLAGKAGVSCSTVARTPRQMGAKVRTHHLRLILQLRGFLAGVTADTPLFHLPQDPPHHVERDPLGEIA